MTSSLLYKRMGRKIMTKPSDQLLEMLRLQDQFNKVVNPNWQEAGYPFYQAIMVEGAEATEHMGYKWWKHNTLDPKQTWIEMVDIWHFGMSMMLLPNEQPCKLTGFHHYMRKIIHAASGDVPYFDVESFKAACESIGMSEDDLYKLYLMKNVLNKFRQDNGYKSGTYIKDWGNEFSEDNLYLEHLFAAKQDWKFDELYAALQTKYTDVKYHTIEAAIKGSQNG